MICGALEAGGTKCICAVGTGVRDMRAREVIPTTHPAETLAAIVRFFTAARERFGPLAAIGIGSFGPIRLERTPRYGQIAKTPKPSWSNVELRRIIEEAVAVPVIVDTDVNCALMGEVAEGAGRHLSDLVYFTVGTGIGAAVMVEGKLAHGFAHPEIGHMCIPKVPEDASFAGVCPFHADRCLEGLTSGPALQARAGRPLSELAEEDPLWDIATSYLAMACANALLWTAPRKIILGGGVMQQAHLFPRLRSKLGAVLNNYVDLQDCGIGMSDLIVPSELGHDAGIAGAFELARTYLQ